MGMAPLVHRFERGPNAAACLRRRSSSDGLGGVAALAGEPLMDDQRRKSAGLQGNHQPHRLNGKTEKSDIDRYLDIGRAEYGIYK
jgi:hypothetical protein